MRYLFFRSNFSKSPAVRLALLLLMPLYSCGSDAPASPVVNNVGTDPEQYGTPFQQVPDARDAVIYQVNIREFSSSRNFNGIINRLDSIKSLGVNVIYLMPIYPVGTVKSVNSPYCVKDYKAVNAEFGTLADLRTLIDKAHTKGMAVILDWVANHTAWDHSWVSAYPGWYVRNNAGVIQSPGTWTDVAQLNFSNADMRKAMIKSMKYWVLTANCDGFRCDYADGPPADFWKQAIDTLRNIKTHQLLMMAEGNRKDHFSSGFNYIFGFSFYEQLKTICNNKQTALGLDNVNTTEYTGAGESNRVVRYITNHDVNSSDGVPQELFGGQTGALTAFTIAAYLKSVPMIYNGQEVGLPYRLSFPFTGTVIDWTLNKDLVAKYKQLIHFYNQSEAIRRGSPVSYSTADICAFTKTSGNEQVMVICNMRNTTQDFVIPDIYINSNWTDAFSNQTVNIGSQYTLTANQSLVLKRNI